jgi:DNA-binding SARP family transcriptional activator
MPTDPHLHHISSPPRRCEVVPPAVAGELVRHRLVARLDDRWNRAVTTVVAGAGFGKSTVLAQAIRHNQAHPRGIDAWVSCEPGDEDADHLAGAVLRALDAPVVGPDPVAAIIGALGRTSPVPVCLVIDDTHELPAGCSSLALLGDVVRALPAHAHMVLAGREPCLLPLARLRAADRVLDLTTEALQFSVDEVEALAAEFGQDPVRLAPLAGWPALVRLTLSAPARVAHQFVWEEVVVGLAPDDRRALLALATLGTADASELAELCGTPVDIDHLAASIPLIAPTGDRRVRAHDLWQETLTAILGAEEVGAMSSAAIGALLARGSYLRAGALAVRVRDFAGLAAAGVTLVRNTLASLPVDTARAWLGVVPSALRDKPEFVLLDAALRHAVREPDPAVSGLLDKALDGFRRVGPAQGEHVALGLQLVAAHTAGDLAALARISEAAERLPDVDEDPTLRVLKPAINATAAHLMGEVDHAAALLDLPLADVPPMIAESLLRLRWHMLVFAGRADEASALCAITLARASTPNAPLFSAVARWLAGDPSGFDDPDLDLSTLDSFEQRRANDDMPYARAWLNHGVFLAMIRASAGDRTTVERAVQLTRSIDLDPTHPRRNGVPIGVARAAQCIIDHDEAAAVAEIEQLLEDDALGDRFFELYLRRFITVPYVCSPAVRARFDHEPIGPTQRLHREVARTFLAAREGTLRAADALPAPPVVHTALPLPWALELAARARSARNPAGEQLAQWLADRLGSVVHDELRWLATQPDRAVARGATELAARVPFPPEQTTRIDVVGPFGLVVDGEPVDRPELRRARVRELLALLALYGSLGRERAIDLLWPDLPVADAARNLRVTLTHVRRLLEPDRGRGGAGYHLRVENDRIRLVASSRLVVDLWETRHHLDAAAAARRTGDIAAQARHLEAAVEHWTGHPLTDLERIPELCTEVEHVRMQLVDAALTLGELRLAEGDANAARYCAERVLAVDPFVERALRLLIGSGLQRADRSATEAAARRVVAALDELGLEPQPATEILLRQARGFVGRPAVASA